MSARVPFTPAERSAKELGLLDGFSRVTEGFWLLSRGGGMEASAKFRSGDGVTLSERCKLELTTSHFETKVYERALRKALAAVPDGVALELGAGDGRITRMLLADWVGPVIACDCNRAALERLHASMEPQQRRRLVVVCGAIEDLSFVPRSVSLAVAIEALYYLGEQFEVVLPRLAAALKPNGKLVHAEPTVEGWLLSCLAMDDWEGALAAAEQGAVENSFRGFEPDEMERHYTQCGLRRVDSDFTPLVNILLVNRLVRSTLPEDRRIEIARRVRACGTAFRIPRCVVYTAERASQQ